MATKKKVRPVVVKKASSSGSSASKKAVKKGAPAPKKSAPKSVSKSVAKPAAKKSPVPAKKAPAKPAPAKKSPAKPAVSVANTSKSPVKNSAPSKTKQAIIALSGKTTSKPVVKGKDIPAKKEAPVKSAPAKSAPEKASASKTVAPKTPAAKTPVKSVPQKEVKPVVPAKAAAKTPASKTKVEPVAADKNALKKKDDKPDPLHEKAAKAIKELEETMDLSKVRPRIQANSPAAPKPAPRPAPTPLKLVEPTNTTKIKYQLEFEFRSSPKILFNTLSDSSGLAGWFADEVKTKDNVYTFVWEGGESFAKLVAIKDQQLVRFAWLDDTDGTYFQFEIKEDDITSDVALIITDFANPGERETNIRLWESQVQKLRMLLGSL